MKADVGRLFTSENGRFMSGPFMTGNGPRRRSRLSKTDEEAALTGTAIRRQID
jgi:hypothetical protein